MARKRPRCATNDACSNSTAPPAEPQRGQESSHLKAAVLDVLHRTRIPLDPMRIARLLVLGDRADTDAFHDFDIFSSSVAIICRHLCETGVAKKMDRALFAPEREEEMRRNLLITSEYQMLGMTLLPGVKDAIRYIPPSAEKYFLEMRTSTLGEMCGLGLFLRRSRAIRQGTIVCEYVGRTASSQQRGSFYCVTTRLTGEAIDARDNERETILCRAALVNDNGPDASNVEMLEIPEHAGRVFLVATRDISEGEELFCLYGARYWGFESYRAIREHLNVESSNARGSKHQSCRTDTKAIGGAVDDANWDFLIPTKCRKCGQDVMKRVRALHDMECGDSLCSAVLHNLESLPMNDLTAVDHCMQPLTRITKMTALYFVNPNEPLTYSNTHMDITDVFDIQVVDQAETT